MFIRDELSLGKGFAADCSRLASASFESICSISKNKKFPKSTAWALIELYYAAFFASHSILRMFGITCSHLETGHIQILRNLSLLYGFSWPSNIGQGYYICSYDCNSKILICSKANDTHADTWAAFHSKLKEISNDVLLVTGITIQKQAVCAYLSNICDAMISGNASRGNWLSQFRNKVNYRQEYGTWFPYKNMQFKYDELEPIFQKWNSDPNKIQIGLSRGKEVRKFVETCTSIISLCKALIKDMGYIGGKKHFHNYGALAFLNFGRADKSKKI